MSSDSGVKAIQPAVISAACLVLTLVTTGPGLEARRASVLDIDTQLAFLKQAKVVSARPIGKGVTGALRLTLSDGVLTHDASFQQVDQQVRPVDVLRGRRTAGDLQFVDSWRYNVAAWELARLLGLEAMMPATVERRYKGTLGAVSWWVEDVLMDEAERERTDTTPPNGLSVDVARQRQRMQVFAELVYDTDRNKGNVIYTRDWRVVMIDFTRAFRLDPALRVPGALTSCDRGLLERLRGLDRQDVSRAAGRHLTPFEIDALMARRDLIVERFDTLVATLGESAVLY